jgi:hypothetical protein
MPRLHSLPGGGSTCASRVRRVYWGRALDLRHLHRGAFRRLLEDLVSRLVWRQVGRVEPPAWVGQLLAHEFVEEAEVVVDSLTLHASGVPVPAFRQCWRQYDQENWPRPQAADHEVQDVTGRNHMVDDRCEAVLGEVVRQGAEVLRPEQELTLGLVPPAR